MRCGRGIRRAGATTRADKPGRKDARGQRGSLQSAAGPPKVSSVVWRVLCTHRASGL
jgi:hypothetical protein